MKQETSIDLPTDMIYYNCDHCSLRLPFRSDGFCEIDSVLNKEIQYSVDGLIENFLKSHCYNGILCPGVLKIDSTELPQNFVILLRESDKAYLVDLNICDNVYKPKIIVVTEANINNAIFALYQKDTDDSHAYVDFIISKFDIYQNDDVKEINNDSEIEEHGQMFGGGRRLKSIKKYICKWCPESVTRRGIKGVFCEYSSYKRHFMKFHHKIESIPIDEFENEVVRDDPKWICPKCTNFYTPKNADRHLQVCGNYEDEFYNSSYSGDESEEEIEEQQEPIAENLPQNPAKRSAGSLLIRNETETEKANNLPSTSCGKVSNLCSGPKN